MQENKSISSAVLGSTTSSYYLGEELIVCCDNEKEAYNLVPFTNKDYVRVSFYFHSILILTKKKTKVIFFHVYNTFL